MSFVNSTMIAIKSSTTFYYPENIRIMVIFIQIMKHSALLSATNATLRVYRFNMLYTTVQKDSHPTHVNDVQTCSSTRFSIQPLLFAGIGVSITKHSKRCC